MFRTAWSAIVMVTWSSGLSACDDGSSGSGAPGGQGGASGSSAGSPSFGGSSTSGGAAGQGGATAGGTSSGGSTGGGDGGGVSEWKTANLTNYESYPDPNSEECIEYNGCLWAGMFAGVDGKQTEQWVMEHNIIAVHQKDFETYKLKTLRLRMGEKEIDAVVYDMCADSDCEGCCTANSAETGFLVDIEKYTMQRFGAGDGIVEWACVDCD
jgi:hypothetical protein